MLEAVFRLQSIVFALVSAAFTNIYITQPVLPVLQSEFSVDMVVVSFSVSAVIFGIALSNLDFGLLADRFPVHPVTLNSFGNIGTSWHLHRIFHYPCYCGWLSQLQTFERAGTRQCVVRFINERGTVQYIDFKHKGC